MMHLHRFLVSSLLISLTILLLASFLSAATGCGYALYGAGSILPADVKRIMIPRVINNTTDSTVASLLTESLRDQFSRFGAVEVVETRGEADALLEVKILQIKEGTRASTSQTDTALQLDSTLVLDGVLRKKNGQILWRDPRLMVTKPFGVQRSAVVTTSSNFVTGNLGAGDLAGLNARELTRGQQQQALSDLADQAASLIYQDAIAPDF